MAIYVGVNGVPKEVSSVYVSVNGTPKEVSEIYVGDNNAPKNVYTSAEPPGETVFTSSGTFTVPKGITKIDVFCVGGGGSGGETSTYWNYTMTNYGSEGQFNSVTGGYGGGGGYTKIGSSISVTPGQSISISIGAGGSGGYKYNSYESYVNDGSATKVTFPNGTSVTANGGHLGSVYLYNVNTATDSANYGYPYSYGGSNGGLGAYAFTSYTYYKGKAELAANPGYYDGGIYKGEWKYSLGQRSTTRYFGESNGTLYAGGGGGGGLAIDIYTYAGLECGAGGDGGGGRGAGYGNGINRGNAGNGDTNTGGGGGGCFKDTYYGGIFGYIGNGSGGSGIAIIRWGK